MWAQLYPLNYFKWVWAMCSEHPVLWKGLFKLEVWAVKQDLIPYVG